MLEELDPWGQARADWYVAMVLAMIANAFRDPKKHREAMAPEKFLPRFQWDEGPVQYVDPFHEERLDEAEPDPDDVPPEFIAEQERLWAKIVDINARLGGTVATEDGPGGNAGEPADPPRG